MRVAGEDGLVSAEEVHPGGRSYTDEQRAQALATLELNGGNATRTARELGIPKATLLSWRNKALEGEPERSLTRSGAPDPLTPRQRCFVAEYLVDLNATQAAIRAGYSERTAASIASENLRKPDIATAIVAAKARRAERTELDQDRVVLELARIAFSDLRNVVEWDGGGLHFRDSDELTPDVAAAVREIRSDRRRMRGRDGRETEREERLVRLYDKPKALELLGRHLGLFPTRMEHSGPEGRPATMEAAMAELTSDEIRALIAGLRST